MRELKHILKDKRRELKEAKLDKINEQKEEVLNRLLRDRHVDSPYALNESNRASLKASLLRMWSPNKGLTPAGHRYLFESEIPELTDKSSPEDIASWISGSIAKPDNMKALFGAFLNLMQGEENNINVIIGNISAEIQKQTNKDIDPHKIAEYITKQVLEELTKKISEVKFTKPEVTQNQDQNQEQ